MPFDTFCPCVAMPRVLAGFGASRTTDWSTPHTMRISVVGARYSDHTPTRNPCPRIRARHWPGERLPSTRPTEGRRRVARSSSWQHARTTAAHARRRAGATYGCRNYSTTEPNGTRPRRPTPGTVHVSRCPSLSSRVGSRAGGAPRRAVRFTRLRIHAIAIHAVSSYVHVVSSRSILPRDGSYNVQN